MDQLYECCCAESKTRQTCLNLTPDGFVVSRIALVSPSAGHRLICVWHSVKQFYASWPVYFREGPHNFQQLHPIVIWGIVAPVRQFLIFGA